MSFVVKTLGFDSGISCEENLIQAGLSPFPSPKLFPIPYSLSPIPYSLTQNSTLKTQNCFIQELLPLWASLQAFKAI